LKAPHQFFVSVLKKKIFVNFFQFKTERQVNDERISLNVIAELFCRTCTLTEDTVLVPTPPPTTCACNYT